MTLALVPKMQTGGDDTRAWLVSRRPLFRFELMRWLAGWADAAMLLSLPFVAHSRNETGAGRAEYNFNLGGIRAFASQNVDAFERSGYTWRSYPSLRAGVSGYLSTMLGHEARRRACLGYLDHGDAARWYREAIIATGYDSDETAIPGFVRLWQAELDAV